MYMWQHKKNSIYAVMRFDVGTGLRRGARAKTGGGWILSCKHYQQMWVTHACVGEAREGGGAGNLLINSPFEVPSIAASIADNPLCGATGMSKRRG